MTTTKSGMPTTTDKDLLGLTITVDTPYGLRAGQVFGIIKVGSAPRVWAIVEDVAGLTTFQGCITAVGHFAPGDSENAAPVLKWRGNNTTTEEQARAGLNKRASQLRHTFAVIAGVGDQLTGHPVEKAEPVVEVAPIRHKTTEEILAEIMALSSV